MAMDWMYFTEEKKGDNFGLFKWYYQLWLSDISKINEMMELNGCIWKKREMKKVRVIVFLKNNIYWCIVAFQCSVS